MAANDEPVGRIFVHQPLHEVFRRVGANLQLIREITGSQQDFCIALGNLQLVGGLVNQVWIEFLNRRPQKTRRVLENRVQHVDSRQTSVVNNAGSTTEWPDPWT